METAVLNVSLDEKVCPGHAVSHRFRMVMAAMRLCFHDVVGEVKTVKYDSPDGPVREDCAVLTVSIESRREVFEHAIYFLAQQFSQDCIAVLYADGQGVCVGPGADRWPFKREFFNLPAICSLGAEAA